MSASLALFAAALLAGAAQAEETPFEVFAEDADGWSVVRRPDGCFAVRRFERRGEPGLNIFFNVDSPDGHLSLIFDSAEWQLSSGEVRGYRLDLTGSGHHWADLAGTNFPRDGEDNAMIGISFSADATDPMLADIAGATEAELSRAGTTIQHYPMAGAATAVRQLLACVRSFPGRTLPALPQTEAAIAPR